uniref:G_PROTEIN_RECEP_F1_2 domain-containing protein n=1 Tax=Macrostomum lignano TaxID=282301 RepID=A0A1I8I8D4_9PLAT
RLNLYLAFLAFSDNLCLIVYGWLWYFPAKTMPFLSNKQLYFYPWNHGVLICKFHRFGMAFVSTMSTTAQLLITVDRCLSIYFPLRFANASNKRAWYGIGAVTLISFIVSAPYFYLMGYSLTSEGQRVCYFADSNTYFWQVTNVLFNNCGLVQVSLMIVANCLLTVRLIRYRRERTNLTEGSKTLSSSEVSASVVLVILSVIMIVGSLPQTIGQTMAMIVVDDPVLVLFAYTLFDTGSTIFFIQ